MKNKKRERALALTCCAAMAALMLLFTSQCSPLYPINVWGDANCLLTVGRVMKRGGVLYRDIYEQKGPLLYLIHALAACLSDTSFWGVYIMEALAMTVALYAAYRLMRLRAGMGFSLGAAAFFGAAFAFANAVGTGTFQPLSSWWEFMMAALLAVITAVLSNLTLVLAVQRIGSTLTSVLGVMEPLTAVFVGILVFNEPFTPALVGGVILISSSVTLVMLGRQVQAIARRFQRKAA